MFCFIFFLVIPAIFSHGLAQIVLTNGEKVTSTVYLNSSRPSVWYNNNSNSIDLSAKDGSRIRAILSWQQSVGFVFGFFTASGYNHSLLSVIVYGFGDDPVVVWSANGDNPVGENASLQLTKDGGLLLRDSEGDNVWSTNTTSGQSSVLGMNMTEAGNLVVFGTGGTVVWQSFDYPTDTLLEGQRLKEGQRLTAAASKSNWSRGLYYATLTSATGFAVYTELEQGQPLMYYQLKPDSNTSTSNRSSQAYAEFRRDGFLVQLGGGSGNYGTYPTSSRYNPVILYLKLESDGHIKINQHNNERGVQELEDMVSEDLGECQYPRSCGEYGFCRQGQCSCPTDLDGFQYFKESIFQLPRNGCSRVTPISCRPLRDQHRLVELNDSTFFNVIDSDAAFPGIIDIDGCRQACLQNCSCGAVSFRYDNSSTADGYCFMPPEILSIREGPIPQFNFSFTTYVKVQIPYEAPIPQPSLELSPPTPRTRRNLAAIISGSVAGGFVVVILVILILVMTQKRNSNDEEDDDFTHVSGMPRRFSYQELCVATADFKERIGAGGFGTVFKGMLTEGTEIAVKRLEKPSQGPREFLAEVESIGSINHCNLVRLIGYCAEKSCRLLVYEYMSNGSLDSWIFSHDHGRCLNWQIQNKIIVGIAKGLAYLHEECRQSIIHLDIKPQNILLDEDFNAKVSDFGLCKVVDRDESQVMTTMRGTPGYLAPEWRLLRITVKVDTYSFGILLLEIVCRRRNLDRSRSDSSAHLLELLQKKAEEDRLLDLVEKQEKDHAAEVERMINIGAWCLQDDHTKRPSMSTVVKVLEGVMDVDSDISYNFTHAMASPAVDEEEALVSAPQEASLLSNPR